MSPEPGVPGACPRPLSDLSLKDEQIAAFVKRLYCKECIGLSDEKRQHPKGEQTRDPQDGPLPPVPDEYEWKRFVSVQRR